VEWSLELGDFPSFLVARARGTNEVVPVPDAILFDPYSPAKNPAMWTAGLFADLFGWLLPDRPCALATYSRSTSVRVALLLAGFYVGIGRSVGSKEETTIAANVRELVPALLERGWLDRVRRSHAAEPLCEAVYRQAPLSTQTMHKLLQHPQFQS
jgi:hypothetical protein